MRGWGTCGSRIAFKFEMAHFAMQIRAFDTELFRCLGDVPIVRLQAIEDKTPFKFMPGVP